MPEMNDRAGFARGGLAAMPALEDAPELYRPAPPPDDPLTRHDARRDEDFALRAAAQATALAGRLMAAPPERSEGLTFTLLQRFDEESAALLDGAPNPQAEQAGRDAVGRARGRLLDWVLPQEAAAQTLARRQTLIEALAQFRAAAEQQPGDADALHAEGAEAIRGAASWLGDQSAERLQGDWTDELYGSAGKSWIAVDPDDAAAKLVAGVYAALPDGLRRELLSQARQSVATKISEAARERDRTLRDSEVTAAQQREEVAATFLSSISSGTANPAALDEAIAVRRLSPSRAKILADELTAHDEAIQERQASIRRAMSYLDGDSTERPSPDDLQAHFEDVLKPIQDGKSPWAKGEILSSYQKALGSLPESAETDLRRELYHADPRRQTEAAEIIASLKSNKGSVLFLPVADFDYAERLRALVMVGHSPDVAVKFAEEGLEEGASDNLNPGQGGNEDVLSDNDEAKAEELVDRLENLPPPAFITTEEAIELARLIAEVLPVTGQAISIHEASAASYAAILALSRGDFRKALSEGGSASLALLGAINPAGGTIRKADDVGKVAVKLSDIIGRSADYRAFKAATQNLLKELEAKLAEARKAFLKELPGTELRSKALSKMRGIQLKVNNTFGKSYEEQIIEELKKFGLTKHTGTKQKGTTFDGRFQDTEGNFAMVEIKTEKASWDIKQKRHQLQHAVDHPDEPLVFIREGHPIEIYSGWDGSAQRALNALPPP